MLKFNVSTVPNNKSAIEEQLAKRAADGWTFHNLSPADKSFTNMYVVCSKLQKDKPPAGSDTVTAAPK